MNINRIVKELKKGNLVITPTDTVYGIMGDALNNDTINKAYDAKKRDYSKPLLILASSKKMLLDYVDSLNDIENELIDKYMPGKLTLLLKKNNKISNRITNNSEYVGIRIPDNKDLLEIISKLGNPVISTSANISNKDVITSVDKIEKELLKYISYVEDGGEVLAKSSTIAKVNNNKIEFLREGDLTEIIKKDFNI